MKHIYLLLASLASLSALAQPVITSSVITPVGGTFEMNQSNTFNNFNPGASGANVSWNFSSINNALGSRTQKVVKADTTFNYSYYPPAVNYAIEVPEQFGIISYAYGVLDQSKFEYYGAMSLSINQVYTNPQKQLTFPFTYNSQHIDYFHDSDSTYFGKVTVKADAYGTLTLPNGTFSNVLRINYKEEYRQITDWDWDGNPSDSTQYEGQYYRWYMPGHTGPLLEYASLKSFMVYQGVRYDIDSLKHVVYSKNATTGIADAQNTFELSVYPNPVLQQLYVKAETPIEQVQLTDLAGRLIATEYVYGKTGQLNVSMLAAGTYCLQVTTADQRRQTLRIAKQ